MNIVQQHHTKLFFQRYKEVKSTLITGYDAEVSGILISGFVYFEWRVTAGNQIKKGKRVSRGGLQVKNQIWREEVKKRASHNAQTR